MLVYLDASVWVKRYVIEEGTKRVRQWFREGPVVATSPLALIEVMSTLVRKERAGELATEDMERHWRPPKRISSGSRQCHY